MSDRLLFSVMALAALLMIALALVWPQGLGARSPGFFGHAPVQQQEAAVREKAPDPVLGLAPGAPVTSGPPER